MNGPLGQAPGAAGGAGAPLDEPLDLDTDTDDDDADTAGVPPESGELDPDVRNGDLALSAADAGEVVATSDPDPADVDGDFPGRPLTDAEIDALPSDGDDED